MHCILVTPPWCTFYYKTFFIWRDVYVPSHVYCRVLCLVIGYRIQSFFCCCFLTLTVEIHCEASMYSIYVCTVILNFRWQLKFHLELRQNIIDGHLWFLEEFLHELQLPYFCGCSFLFFFCSIEYSQNMKYSAIDSAMTHKTSSSWEDVWHFYSLTFVVTWCIGS